MKAVFNRSAYGCRLYCCWCAQNLDANYFWESLGFVPIAFRAGSMGKKRVHIFWQRRIVEDDVTPWWYPFQTNSGAIREDRVVFPIPPGVPWRDVRAVEVPQAENPEPGAPRARWVPSQGRSPRPDPTKPASAPLGGFSFQSERPAQQAKAKAPKPKGAAGEGIS